MKFRVSILSIAAVGAVALISSCGGGSQTPIDPINDPDRLSTALSSVKIAGQEVTRQEGELPTATADADSPSVFLLVSSKIGERGKQVSIPFSVNAVNPLDSLFAKVDGAPDFFVTVLEGSTKFQQDLELQFRLPGNLRNGQFCIDLAVRDELGLVGVTDEPVCIFIGGVEPTPTPTGNPTASPTPTVTVAPTPTVTAAPTPTVTVAPTSNPTPTATAAPTATASPTPTTTAAPTPTATVAPTPTVMATPTPTPSVTAPPDPTLTPTPTLTGITGGST